MHLIRKNKKYGTNDPVLTIKRGKINVYAHEVSIEGPSKVIYSPDKPLSCGARVWISTEANFSYNIAGEWIGDWEIPFIKKRNEVLIMGPAPPKKTVKQMRSVQKNMNKIPRTKAKVKK